MSLGEFLILVERFQTLLVGVVGFAGVIWTLRVKGRQAQVAYERDIS